MKFKHVKTLDLDKMISQAFSYLSKCLCIFFFCFGPQENQTNQEASCWSEIQAAGRQLKALLLGYNGGQTVKTLLGAEVKNEWKVGGKLQQGSNLWSGSKLAEGYKSVTGQKGLLGKNAEWYQGRGPVVLARPPHWRSVVVPWWRLSWGPKTTWKRSMQKHLWIKIQHKKIAKLNTSWGVEEELGHPSDLQANCEQADTDSEACCWRSC